MTIHIPTLDNPDGAPTGPNSDHPFMQKSVNVAKRHRNLECWVIHLGGEKYLSVTEDDNYIVVNDVHHALRFALSDYNRRLIDTIMQRLVTRRAEFGNSPRRMRVVWEHGKKLTALNEVRD